MTSEKHTPRELAETALELAYTDPRLANTLAVSALAGAGGDAATTSIAGQALGLAAVAVGDVRAAREHLAGAVATSDRAGLDRWAAEARGSLAYVLTLLGEPVRALRVLERALPAVSGVPGARLRMQRALVLDESGRFAEAADAYADAMAALAEAGGDRLVEASLRNNRSILRARMGDWRGAEEDLRRAEENYTATGHLGRIAMVAHNRGLAAAARGDVPAALAAYDEAATRYRASGRDPGLLPVEHAETLLSVGLVSDARRMAAASVAAFTRASNATDLVQARIVLATAALAAGDAADALDAADRARRAAGAQRRPGWTALARYLALRARWLLGQRTAATLRAGCATADALDAAGWVAAAADARVIVARTALESGRRDLARRELARAGRVRHTGPVQARVRAWHATALYRHGEGDRRGALAAARAGLRILTQFQAGLGATELRVHTSWHGQDLAELGIRLALGSGRPESVLWWAEQWRAGALRHRPARPSDDTALEAALADLRRTAADADAAIADGGDARALVRAQVAVEDRVRRLSRHAGVIADPVARFDVRALGHALGGRALVEFLVLDGDLHALVVRDRRTSLRRLGSAAGVWRDLEILRFSLRTTAYGIGSPRALAGAGARITALAARLDDVLFGPLPVGGGDLVIVPTGKLHGLAWSVLPTCAGRAVSVIPSAALWLRAKRQAAAEGRRVVLAAGPDLAGAVAEVDALARAYTGALRFTGRRARVGAVIAAMDGAAVVHIAAHGALRADNPQFSSLRLADGPLTVYDLERLVDPPELVVLSACDSGLSAVHPGDEVAGLATALLAMGSRVLIAPVIPVPDHASRHVSLRLHRHLHDGLRPAEALARTRARFAGADPAHRTAAFGLQCFGAG